MIRVIIKFSISLSFCFCFCFGISGADKNVCRKEKADNRTSWLLHEGVGDDEIEKEESGCFMEPSTKIENEVRSLQSSGCNSDSSTSCLPAWLQQYKNENKGINNHQVLIIITIILLLLYIFKLTYHSNYILPCPTYKLNLLFIDIYGPIIPPHNDITLFLLVRIII